jgi:hypothetical protein
MLDQPHIAQPINDLAESNAPPPRLQLQFPARLVTPGHSRPTEVARAGLEASTEQYQRARTYRARRQAPILVSMAADLLMSAAQREITTLDEKLYLQVYGKPETDTSRRAAAAR